MSFVFLRKKPFSGLVVVFVFITLQLLIPSCEKNEGTGGTGSITGTIIEQSYNEDYSRLIYQKPAVDEEVFIVYGDDNVLGDRTFTSLTGKFRFDYLYPGRYYVYYQTGDSSTILDEDQEKIYLVDLERGEEVDLGHLEKLTPLDYDDGAAVIKGVVKVINYVNESRWPNLVIEDIAFAHEQEVYLTFDNQAFYKDRIRTQFDGYFEFNNLIPGDYLVFLYSEDVTRVTEHVVLKFEVTINDFDQVVDLGEITIEKL